MLQPSVGSSLRGFNVVHGHYALDYHGIIPVTGSEYVCMIAAPIFYIAYMQYIHVALYIIL